MRLIALLITGILASSPVAAQQPEASSSTASSPSKPDGTPTTDLPVSLDKIRDGLERPTSGHLFARHFIKSLDNQPTFRVDIEERRKIDELIASLDFKSGPVPPGGLYAYEQQRMMVPAVDNPLAQPYAAFNQGQLLTVLVEDLVAKSLGGRAVEAIAKSIRERAEVAARKEVDDSIAEYCAAKPDNGAGIQLCAPQPPQPAR